MKEGKNLLCLEQSFFTFDRRPLLEMGLERRCIWESTQEVNKVVSLVTMTENFLVVSIFFTTWEMLDHLWHLHRSKTIWKIVRMVSGSRLLTKFVHNHEEKQADTGLSLASCLVAGPSKVHAQTVHTQKKCQKFTSAIFHCDTAQQGPCQEFTLAVFYCDTGCE